MYCNFNILYIIKIKLNNIINLLKKCNLFIRCKILLLKEINQAFVKYLSSNSAIKNIIP